MQGCRLTMEDFTVVSVGPKVSVAAVFDGHGGDHVARILHDELVPAIQTLPEYTGPAISQLFDDFNAQHFAQERKTGSTAVVLIVTSEKVFLAHAGDSRAYGQFDLETEPFRLLTPPHEPNAPTEKERILKCGRKVEDNRVDGLLAVARAFGDTRFAPAVIATPDILEFDRPVQTMRFVLVSDGLTERTTDAQVADRISQTMKGDEPHNGSMALCEWALRNHSTDNMSVVTVEIDGDTSPKPFSSSFGDIHPPQNFEDMDREGRKYREAYQRDLMRYPKAIVQ